MKKRYLTITIILLVTNVMLFSQEESRKQERDIKISGNYYYGDGMDVTESEACKMAYNEMKMMISEELMEENPEITSVDFKGFEDNIGTITIPLEGRIRVIAFLLKKEMQINSLENKKLMVIRVSPDGPSLAAISNTDKSKEASINLEDKNHPNNTACNSNDSISKITNEEIKVKDMETIIEPINKKKGKKESAKNVESSVEKIEPKSDNVAKIDSISIDPNLNTIIADMIKLIDSKEVGVFLNEHKNKGKLIYGKLNTLEDPAACYFIVLQNGKLKDVLDKSTTANRKGLISGDDINYSNTMGTIYWIYLIEN